MSDTESDSEEVQKVEHIDQGPIEDAWKMKIPEFKEEDNRNGLFCYSFVLELLNSE